MGGVACLSKGHHKESVRHRDDSVISFYWASASCRRPRARPEPTGESAAAQSRQRRRQEIFSHHFSSRWAAFRTPLLPTALCPTRRRNSSGLMLKEHRKEQ